MTYEEKKKVVEAAMFLEKNCEKCFSAKQCDCPLEVNHECAIAGWPKLWNIPKLTRWTPEDVALAKALKAVGAKVIYNTLGRVYWRTDNVYTCGELPNGAFTAIKKCESFSIDTIIEESEE